MRFLICSVYFKSNCNLFLISKLNSEEISVLWTNDLNISTNFNSFMVFSATFNDSSVISWRSVLLVEEIVVPGENHQPFASN